MTQKHYIKLAEIIKESTILDERMSKPLFLKHLMRFLKEDNSKFDADKFVDACYEEDER
jgi:hypothetical protein